MRNRYRRKVASTSLTITAKRVLLPGLLIAVISLLSAKDAFHFDNGSGGAGWKIGKPKVTLLTAHSNRSLPETRQFATLTVLSLDPPAVEFGSLPRLIINGDNC